MPRYYFYIADGDLFPDEEGAHLPDISAAIQMAAAAAREMIADDLKRGKDLPLDDRIEIHDESGRVVRVVTFREAVGLERRPE